MEREKEELESVLSSAHLFYLIYLLLRTNGALPQQPFMMTNWRYGSVLSAHTTEATQADPSIPRPFLASVDNDPARQVIFPPISPLSTPLLLLLIIKVGTGSTRNCWVLSHQECADW